jgi:uncharacterized pyridoxal phosphate-containing UPF0001 family protein
LIGHLQTNKVKPALKQFAWIDSVDSLRLARPIPDLLQSLPELNQLLQVQIVGLMTILPLGLSSEAALDLFRKLAELADYIQRSGYEHLQVHTLSMGMSDDYLLAVAAGSNLIRLGRALFADAEQE